MNSISSWLAENVAELMLVIGCEVAMVWFFDNNFKTALLLQIGSLLLDLMGQ